MMQEQVCITPLAINKAGQVKHFQIRLPKTAKKVIGVEIGGRFLNGSKLVPNINSDALFKCNQLVGELKLQSCEEANVFYAGELRLDSNMAYGDYTKNTQWIPEVFTHQMQTFEDVVITNADSTVINGMYKDNIGLQNQQSVSYLLNVYLWYSK
ncbi:MAG: hypothetical protein Q7W45_01000 [Bacteroidota bacterium]|nr:hypothetical protein [Bacteroidota bacterium]MDP3146676.1 hypothetical protein [Bacteroidota bacterium]